MTTFSIAIRNAQLDQHNAQMIRRFAREAGPTPIARGATAGGDQRRLRGIPAIGRGVQGAIPGTRP